MSSKKPRNPDLTPEMLAYIESDDPGCGKEFVLGLCRTRHLAAKVREARGLEYGPCAYCLHFVTKSADKPETPAIEPQITQEEPETMEPKPEPTPKKAKPAKPVLTCSICGNPRGKNPSGLCRPCSARRNAENARAAKPNEPAPEKTCVDGCGKTVSKSSATGRCHSCASKLTAKAKAAAINTASESLAAKLKAPVDLPGIGTCPEPAADSIHANNSDIASVSLDGIEFSANTEPKTVEQIANKYGYSIVTPSSKAESIYRRALRYYGDRNQIFKAAEEASELSAAIMRYMGASDLGLRSSLLLALVEELADVEIMCQQMRLVFGDQPIDAAKRQKIERLERRLEE